MKKNKEIIVSSATLNSIKNNLKDKKQKLYLDLQQNSADIVSLLDGYIFKDVRGDVHDVTINESTVKINSKGIGQFKAEFDVFYYFGCSDIDKSEEESMNISIIVDLQTGLTMITGEDYPEEREPDSY